MRLALRWKKKRSQTRMRVKVYISTMEESLILIEKLKYYSMVVWSNFLESSSISKLSKKMKREEKMSNISIRNISLKRIILNGFLVRLKYRKNNK